MISSVLLLVIVIGLGVLVSRQVGRHRPAGATVDPQAHSHAVRRFFQYLLLCAMVVVVGVGLAGLLGQLLDRSTVLEVDPTGPARDGAFVVVGVPLCAGLALWSRRAMAADPKESRSLAWVLYVTATSLTALVLTMIAAHTLLRWVVGLAPYDGRALATTLVWGGIWGAHWWLDSRLTPAPRSRPHHLAGSLIGLGTAATGLIGLLAGTLDVVLRVGGGVLVQGDDPIRRGAVTLAVGAPVWYLYWTRRAARTTGPARTTLWLAYVLLAGVGSGLVAAIVSASRALYDVLVWLVGTPASPQALEHFRNIPTALATTAVGTLVWWYHHALVGRPDVAVPARSAAIPVVDAAVPAVAVPAAAGPDGRTEVRRVYEYLMAGLSLVAAAAGLTVLLVALIEASTTSFVLVGDSAVNTLLAAVTLIAVGGSVWALYWLRIQRIARVAPLPEHASPTRRTYLMLLLGIGGVAAVVATLVAVSFLFEDLFAAGVTTATLRRMRYPLGILVAAGAIAAYHAWVFGIERHLAAVEPRRRRFVLLVGPQEPGLAEAVARGAGARVEAWPRTDDAGPPWQLDDVVSLLEHTSADDVVVVSEPDGLHAIPVHRP